VMANFAKSFELAFAGVLSLLMGLVQLLALQRRREMLGEEMRRGPRGEFFEGSGMLANKPRNTQRLTEWRTVQVRPGQILRPGSGIPLRPMEPLEDYFVCGRCGEIHFVSNMKWIPNYDPQLFEDFDNGLPPAVDPGGGRYVILCPCGVGHFKLKTQ
jgi:hypothetical protein